MWAGSPRRGRRWVPEDEGSSAPAALLGRYNYFRSQTRASRLRGIYTNSITISHLCFARSGSPRSPAGVIRHRFDRTPASPFRHPRNG